MEKKIESIWIESEEKGAIINGHSSVDDNSDVIVTFNDSSRYIATFFTYANITTLINKNSQTGECLSGKYFWARDMILIEQIERRNITEIIQYLLIKSEFNHIFKRLE